MDDVAVKRVKEFQSQADGIPSTRKAELLQKIALEKTMSPL